MVWLGEFPCSCKGKEFRIHICCIRDRILQKKSGPHKFLLHDDKHQGWKVKDQYNSKTLDMVSRESPDCPTDVNAKATDWWYFKDSYQWVNDSLHSLNVEYLLVVLKIKNVGKYF